MDIIIHFIREKNKKRQLGCRHFKACRRRHPLLSNELLLLRASEKKSITDGVCHHVVRLHQHDQPTIQ